MEYTPLADVNTDHAHEAHFGLSGLGPFVLLPNETVLATDVALILLSR